VHTLRIKSIGVSTIFFRKVSAGNSQVINNVLDP
jgi:hypothetical protein